MYVLDEEVILTNGIWEGQLKNQNINPKSIMIYTEKKLKGNRISSFAISGTNHLKIYSSNEKVFITYEALGENLPPMLSVATEVIQPKASEDEKADKAYVDMELQKKADKISTFTKQEVMKKIEENGGNISIIDGGSFI
ncbi:hypothetical protein [Psychrobacillus sp. NPDC093180]|uniref:hypothetical protein n=1 Tax=Psychrobacillus sp. NPDC093180 TaxID=3364489 RepID=UPI003818124E